MSSYSTWVFRHAYCTSLSEAEYMKVASVLATKCASTQWHTPLTAPAQPHPRFWNRERNASVIELLSLIFPPPLVSLWLNVFYLSVGGCRGGWGRGRRGLGGGSVALVTVMKGLFHSFTLPVFPPFSCLRHLIKQAWIVDVTLSASPPPSHSLLSASPQNILPPSHSTYLSRLCLLSTCDHQHPSSHSLAHNAAQRPLTASSGGKKLKFKLNVNIKTLILDFLLTV